MSLSIAKRQVTRDVGVMKCDRCKVEVLEETGNGWMHCCILEVAERGSGPLGMGPPEIVVQTARNTTRHLCPACTDLVVKVLNDVPLPTEAEKPAPAIAAVPS